MSSVHAVLRNWDILQVIIDFIEDGFSRDSGRRDLVAVALSVCRVLSDLALNVLWRDVNMENIYFLFPKDMVHVHPGGIKSLTGIPDTAQEWKRFDLYASRIRELEASPFPDDLFLLSAQTRYQTSHHPFPNLTCLQWSSTPSRSSDAITLMSPTLTEVRVTIDVTAYGFEFEEAEDDDTVADTFLSLGKACPRLRKLQYEHYSMTRSRSKAVEASLIYLIHQCCRLEDVHLPVSRDLLRTLGRLPHLSTLRLDYVAWEDGSQSHVPIEVDEWIETTDRFPVLDGLTIQYSHTVSSLTECFQGSGCFPRESFVMWEMSECDQWSTPAIAEFFRGILRTDRSEGLLVFWIDRPGAVENSVGHDPWQALRCLSSIPNLQTLSFNGLFLDIRDSHLKEIARIWRELQYLSLNIPRTDDFQSQISFQGLAHLSTLEDLETVTLMLAPQSTISESMLSPSTLSNSRLKRLKIQGKFPPVTTDEAALFLILHFPRLKTIETSLGRDKGEEERFQEMQALLDATRPMMKNLRSERRSLRYGPGEDGGD